MICNDSALKNLNKCTSNHNAKNALGYVLTFNLYYFGPGGRNKTAAQARAHVNANKQKDASCSNLWLILAVVCLSLHAEHRAAHQNLLYFFWLIRRRPARRSAAAGTLNELDILMHHHTILMCSVGSWNRWIVELRIMKSESPTWKTWWWSTDPWNCPEQLQVQLHRSNFSIRTLDRTASVTG